MNDTLRVTPLLLLLVAPFASAPLTGCFGGCGDATDEYGGTVSEVTLTAGMVAEHRLDISFPADDSSTSVWVDFALHGCASTDEGAGEYRLLRADGSEITTGSMSGWCLPDSSRTGGGFVDELPRSEFDCAAERCVGAFRVELRPSSTFAASEIEARLNRSSVGTCADAAGRGDARIDAWDAL